MGSARAGLVRRGESGELSSGSGRSRAVATPAAADDSDQTGADRDCGRHACPRASNPSHQGRESIAPGNQSFRTTRNRNVLGLPTGFPFASYAWITTMWFLPLPGPDFAFVLNGDVQGSAGAPSKLHL